MEVSVHTSAREQGLQVLRAAATGMVIIIHVCAWYILSRDPQMEQFRWFAYIFKAFASNAVPLFVMIMGYLALKDVTSTKVFLLKKVKRIAIPLVIWEVVYSIYTVSRVVFSGRHVSILGMLVNEIIFHPYYHLWYMFMIVWLLLLTPIIKGRWQRAELRTQVLVTGIAIVFSLLLGILGISSKLSVFQAATYLGYFLAGSVVMSIIKSGKIRIPTYAILSIAMVGYIGIAWSYFHDTLPIASVLSSIGGYAATLSVFIGYIQLSKVVKPSRLILFIDEQSFGIYLIHALVLDVYTRLIGGRLALAMGISALVLEAGLILVVSYVGVLALRKIGLKYIV